MDFGPFDTYDVLGYMASGLLVIVAMELVLGFPAVIGKKLRAVDTAVLLLSAYVIGQGLAIPAGFLLEERVVFGMLRAPSVNLLRARPAVRGFVFHGYYTPLPEERQRLIRARATRERVPGGGEALFLHVRYTPGILSNEALIQKLDMFNTKYGFARNVSFTSSVVGLVLLVCGWWRKRPDHTKYAVGALVVGVLLFYRYLFFFRQYTYELFNVYAGGS